MSTVAKKGLSKRQRRRLKQLESHKAGNWVAKDLVTNPQFRSRTERDRSKYCRKVKHRANRADCWDVSPPVFFI